MGLPLLGRLRALEWPPLIFGLLLVVLESFLRVITSHLPAIVIHMFEKVTRRIYSVFVPGSSRAKNVVRDVHDARGFVEICELFGYSVEEHIVRTTDGYLLGVHRIYQSKKEAQDGVRPSSKPVVYLHHGLLMNSEIWVCLIDPARCLPFELVEKGYDVWLGNNRGNKYSKKHIVHNSTESAFWNFSMDEFALYDIPDTIDYILNTTGQKSLAYIGFSQGSAQAFAALSLHPLLNDKVKLFVALAPAMAPNGLHNGVVDALIKASPTIMYLFFGRKAILSSAIFWQSIMYPPLFVRLIDRSLIFLFNWHGSNISFYQKIAAYAHLYSFTSVKSVVHWFQIMRHGCFQMFDDDASSPIRLYGQAYYQVAQFPTRNIRTPIYLVYGTRDSLVDIDAMLSELPKHAVAIPVEGHEHLDIIWGQDVGTKVLPHIFQILQKTVPATSTASALANLKILMNNESSPSPAEDVAAHASSQFLDSDLLSSKENSASLIAAPEESDEESVKTTKHSTNSPSPPPGYKRHTSPTTSISNFSKDGIVLSTSEPITGMSGPELTSSKATSVTRARADSASSKSAASIVFSNVPAVAAVPSPLGKSGNESLSSTIKKRSRKLFGMDGSGSEGE